MTHKHKQSLFFLGLTLSLVGFFLPWLAHEAAGLSFIGLEMGEQAKFLPQVRSGQIRPARSLFYLPPITVALIIILLTTRWPERRWQTWAARALAGAVSLLAFPAIEAIGAEPEEWLWRVILIALVAGAAVLAPLLRRLSRPSIYALMFLLALAGASLPLWVYSEVRGAFSGLLGAPFGIGAGVWLHLGGHLLIMAMALLTIRQATQSS